MKVNVKKNLPSSFVWAYEEFKKFFERLPEELQRGDKDPFDSFFSKLPGGRCCFGPPPAGYRKLYKGFIFERGWYRDILGDFHSYVKAEYYWETHMFIVSVRFWRGKVCFKLQKDEKELKECRKIER